MSSFIPEGLRISQLEEEYGNGMRVVYRYPEGARSGDVFVIGSVEHGPDHVTIYLAAYTPPAPARPDEYALGNGQALQAGDEMYELLNETGLATVGDGRGGRAYLLLQSYKTARARMGVDLETR